MKHSNAYRLVFAMFFTGVLLTGGLAQADPSRYDIYATVRLTADLSHLSDRQKQMIPILIEASEIMDELFWQQAWGDKEALLSSIENPKQRRFADINYGPWDRLAADKPFLESADKKPLGARFYPEDMSKEEFEAWEQDGKDGLYTLVRRNDAGQLTLLPYHVAYRESLEKAAELLRKASLLAEDPEFAAYLTMRADALLTDDFQPSDMAWMDMKNNPIELVIGPIETYEDLLFGYRTAYESYVLIKDLAWSERLARFAQYLPELQRNLPAPDAYKQEMPGSDADLNAYDVVYYAGHSNAGSKTIAINLPNDEEVQLAKGTRRLQLKNAMLAKYNQILVPISEVLIAEDQRQHITFDAFFGNTMFHEVAHGLGIKNTLDGQSTVRHAMKEHASALEEGKADILGLYMVQELRKKGEISEGEVMDNYVTFLAGIFRSVRFGASSAHGKANMLRFNFFAEAGAFSRNDDDRTYRVNVEQFEEAVQALSSKILTLQGDGDYAAADEFVRRLGGVSDQLQGRPGPPGLGGHPGGYRVRTGAPRYWGSKPMSQPQRVAVKIGSQVLCDPEGELNVEVLTDLVRQVARLREKGWQVLLISSGAVAAGHALAEGPLKNISDPVARKQVMAATGQVRLMETYRALFEQHGLVVAQVLASKADFQTRRHYLNMRGCIEALLTAGIVPIVNENDVVAITELMFTDNDELAGLLAGMVNADRLCLLSTVPGRVRG